MRELVDAHTHHFTFGLHLGQSDCGVPTCGINWKPTRQPICLDHWPCQPMPKRAEAAYTTVMNWSVANRVEFAEQTWGQKDIEFLRIMALPQTAHNAPLCVAVAQTTGQPFPAEEARAAGWQVLNPQECAGDWKSYRQFIYDSLGEFSVAKETYVKARTGWFSCRSACYLAAGRPVILQDTGWSEYLPAGEGLLAFHDLASAAESLRQVELDRRRHAAAARQIAADVFDSRKVLGEMLQQLEM
jgi:hypothetical protein